MRVLGQSEWSAKKSAALAGAPENESSNFPYGGYGYEGPAHNSPVPLVPGMGLVPGDGFTPWYGGAAPEQAPVATEQQGIFTTIGEKDTRRAAGPELKLPGELGRFLGPVIERHEWALALRGDKGAGKSRLQYQALNLFASLGLKCALLSLEIDKNSSVVTRYRDMYIAPGNRQRVLVASECAGIKTVKEAAQQFDVVAIDSWGKIPGVKPEDFDALRKAHPLCLFIVIFQSTTAGTARGGSAVEYDASAVCQVNVPGVAVMEKNRYATGAADEFQFDVNSQKLVS